MARPSPRGCPAHLRRCPVTEAAIGVERAWDACLLDYLRACLAEIMLHHLISHTCQQRAELEIRAAGKRDSHIVTPDEIIPVSFTGQAMQVGGAHHGPQTLACSCCFLRAAASGAQTTVSPPSTICRDGASSRVAAGRSDSHLGKSLATKEPRAEAHNPGKSLGVCQPGKQCDSAALRKPCNHNALRRNAGFVLLRNQRPHYPWEQETGMSSASRVGSREVTEPLGHAIATTVPHQQQRHAQSPPCLLWRLVQGRTRRTRMA